jgi:hypothetical protein
MAVFDAAAFARGRPGIALAAAIVGLLLGIAMYSIFSALRTCYGHYTFSAYC